MRKVLVIGSGGAGKSTLSVELGQVLGLPVIHLDRLFWLPGWVQTDKQQKRKVLAELVTGREWIMDGNYGGSLDIRIPAADTIIFMDYSLVVCLWRVVMRRVRYKGGSRPDMADGCPERVNLEFMKWVWNFRRDHRPGLLRTTAARRPDTDLVMLRNSRETASFMSQVRVRRHGAASGLDQGRRQ